jgi:filamentous hemagglutinin family protein
MKRLGLVSLLALATAQAAPAQTVVTDIRADTDPARSLGTTVTTNGRTRTINGGKLSGSNLFHSFSMFDLGTGDTARWVHTASNPASIANIINRVTGGNPSDIFGRLDTTAIPNADFFFINPAGIVFGAGAVVAVPNAAHFSTAREVRFADGVTFTISTPSGSQFSMADPTSFGFVGARGDIRLTGATTSLVPAGTSFSASGRNVEVTSSRVEANGLRLAAIGSATAEVPVSGTIDSVGDGRLSISASRLTSTASQQDRGDISLAGARMVLDDTDLRAQAGDAGSPDVQIRSSDLAVLNGSLIATLTGTTAGAA